MASIIKLKRSSTQGSIPSSLELGEIAVNLYDRRLYVGNTTGVTAVGGEEFKLTTQEAGGDGAYIKLLGETTPTTNTVALLAGEGLDITLESNGSITFSGEDATVSNKGVASFATADFNVSSGAVELKDTVVKTVASDSGSATPSTHGITIAGTSNEIETSGTGATITIGLPDDVTIGQDLTVTRDASVGQDLAVTRNQTVGGTLSVDGAISLNGVTATTVQANGAVTLNNTLAVDGTSSLNDVTVTTISSNGEATFASATVSDLTSGRVVLAGTSGSLNDSGNLTFNGSTLTVTGGIGATGSVDVDTNLNVDGSTTLNALTATTFTANNDATIGGQLNVSENAVVAGNTSVGGDLTVSGDTHIDGSLTVEGALTYISTSTVYADDGMFKLAANNAGDTVDTGIYAAIYNTGNTSYSYSGYFRDATDGVFKFYKDLDSEPTQTVDVSDTGYALAQVDAIIDGGTY